MSVRLPRPLRPGDTIAVTAPSSGVPDALLPRLEVAVGDLRAAGYDVVVGECLRGGDVVSAPAPARAAELEAYLLDPAVRAVVPPWGGETAVDLLRLLDWDAIAAAEPTWVVGYSDVATLLLPLTVRAGIATLHGPNLMELPYRVPQPHASWLEVATAPPGATLTQGAAPRHRSGGHDDWATAPDVREHTLDVANGGWRLLDDADDGADLAVDGVLVGGCLQTVANLAGSALGDLPGFAAASAPDGLLVHLEAPEADAYEVCRRLHGLRLAGWFDAARAVLIARTHAPGRPGMSQDDAVRDALGDLGVPVVLDVDCGHVAPQMVLVNGAHATVRRRAGAWTLDQRLG